MRFIITVLLSVFVISISAQELKFNKALGGIYENTSFQEELEVDPAGEAESTEKEELFRVMFKKKNTEDKKVIFREIKGSQLGEWYSTAAGQVYIRFTLQSDGSVIAELGNDKNYDQVIDVYRTFNYKGEIETSELVRFDGKTNEDQINGNVMGEQTREKCAAEKEKLNEYFIENEEAEIYETKGQRLYVVSQVYGSHETMKGVLINYTDLDGSYEITHKVDIWYQPNKDDYGCAFQIFKCGEKTKLERYTVSVNEDKSMITLNGKGFKRVKE
jgi:hypothetical protein